MVLLVSAGICGKCLYSPYNRKEGYLLLCGSWSYPIVCSGLSSGDGFRDLQCTV